MKGPAFLFALVGVAIALIVPLGAVKWGEPYQGPPPPKGEKAILFQTAATAACRCSRQPGADHTACWAGYRNLTDASGGSVGFYPAVEDSWTDHCFGDWKSPDHFCVTLVVNGRGTCAWDEPPTGDYWDFTPALAPNR